MDILKADADIFESRFSYGSQCCQNKIDQTGKACQPMPIFKKCQIFEQYHMGSYAISLYISTAMIRPQVITAC